MKEANAKGSLAELGNFLPFQMSLEIHERVEECVVVSCYSAATGGAYTHQPLCNDTYTATQYRVGGE